MLTPWQRHAVAMDKAGVSLTISHRQTAGLCLAGALCQLFSRIC